MLGVIKPTSIVVEKRSGEVMYHRCRLHVKQYPFLQVSTSALDSMSIGATPELHVLGMRATSITSTIDRVGEIVIQVINGRGLLFNAGRNGVPEDPIVQPADIVHILGTQFPRKHLFKHDMNLPGVVTMVARLLQPSEDSSSSFRSPASRPDILCVLMGCCTVVTIDGTRTLVGLVKWLRTVIAPLGASKFSGDKAKSPLRSGLGTWIVSRFVEYARRCALEHKCTRMCVVTNAIGTPDGASAWASWGFAPHPISVWIQQALDDMNSSEDPELNDAVVIQQAARIGIPGTDNARLYTADDPPANLVHPQDGSQEMQSMQGVTWDVCSACGGVAKRRLGCTKCAKRGFEDETTNLLSLEYDTHEVICYYPIDTEITVESFGGLRIGERGTLRDLFSTSVGAQLFKNIRNVLLQHDCFHGCNLQGGLSAIARIAKMREDLLTSARSESKDGLLSEIRSTMDTALSQSPPSAKCARKHLI